jgi:hypothetical protein
MSEPTVIEAIKKRNEERVAAPWNDDDEFDCHADDHWCPRILADDVGTLLAEIASRDAEIERLREVVERLDPLGDLR